MNRPKEEANHIQISFHLDIDHDVESGYMQAEEVISTKEKWETLWKKLSVIACIIAIFMDPLFFYIPFINRRKMCLGTDKTLRTAVLISRSLADFTFVVHIIYQIRQAMKDASKANVQRRRKSKVFNWFEHVMAIASKLSRRSFVIDILAVLPIPQLLVLILFYAPYGFSENKMTVNYLLLVQYLPRMYRIFLSTHKFRNNSSMWFKAAFYFFTYIFASHVIGAFWYFSSLQVETICWQDTIRSSPECQNPATKYCPTFQCDNPPLSMSIKAEINATCPGHSLNAGIHNFGIFAKSIESGYTGRTRFRGKLFYFMWWGLKNLSNFGTNLEPSSFVWENCFAILVSAIGLILFAFLIGNMQECMQSAAEKKLSTDKVEMIEQELLVWMERNGLPEKLGKDAEKLKIGIMAKITEKLKQNQDSDLENLFSLIPWNSIESLKSDICMSMLKQVPMLKDMDDRGLRLLCNYLKPVTYTEKTIAFQMGEPLDSMLFLMEGILLIYKTSNAITTPSTISGSLENIGDVYGGEQLLRWASPSDMPVSYANLPICSENVKCLSQVEGFVLTAKDLKTVVSMYKLSGNYNHFYHLGVEVDRSVLKGISMIRRNRITRTPRPGTPGGEDMAIQESVV